MSAKRRPGNDSPFSKLFTDSAYGLDAPIEPVIEPVAEPLIEPLAAPVPDPVPELIEEMPTVEGISEGISEIISEAAPRRRGRPATGKRSDPNWLGRTFYINKDIDRQIELALIKLKQSSGLELDKSELVNGLLAAWLQAQQTEQSAVSMAEILKIQRPQDPPVE
jgi:hypothetical protein